jgi:hypothetical protein
MSNVAYAFRAAYSVKYPFNDWGRRCHNERLELIQQRKNGVQLHLQGCCSSLGQAEDVELPDMMAPILLYVQ